MLPPKPDLSEYTVTDKNINISEVRVKKQLLNIIANYNIGSLQRIPFRFRYTWNLTKPVVLMGSHQGS